jgi:SAM-dependent methyltransferase
VTLERSSESAAPFTPPISWCCSYCGALLEPRGRGLFCPAEDRWFATEGAVHRLLTAERRQQIQPFLELYQRVRRDEGWRAEPGLPEVPPNHPHAGIWRRRARHFSRGMALLRERLGRGPWSVLEVGAGCCWAAARLIAQGHQVTAVDVNLDPEDGLPAADRLLAEPARLARAEAEMDALPLAAGSFDVVLATGALHYARRPDRTLVELRRVTRRGGWLLVLDSPVYRRPRDGRAMVKARARDHLRRFFSQPGTLGGLGGEAPLQSSFFVYRDLAALFGAAGWDLEIHGWPGRWREWLRDRVEILRHGRRTARFPALMARREG